MTADERFGRGRFARGAAGERAAESVDSVSALRDALRDLHPELTNLDDCRRRLESSMERAGRVRDRPAVGWGRFGSTTRPVLGTVPGGGTVPVDGAPVDGL